MTRARDALNAEAARAADGARSTKDYVFEGPDGEVSLLDLFEGRRQLIVHHFMFDPSWDDGCPSCTAGADEISDGLLRPPARPRHHVRGRLARADRQDRALQGEAGLDVPVVLVLRQRLQLRLPRHARRVGRAGRVQLPRRRPSSRRRGDRAGSGRAAVRATRATAASCATATRVFHTYSVYARGPESARRLVLLPRPDRARPPGGLGGAQGPRRRRTDRPPRFRQLASLATDQGGYHDRIDPSCDG